MPPPGPDRPAAVRSGLRTSRARNLAANVALATASLAVLAAALELAAPWLVMRLPLKLHVTLDRYQRPLAQTSKQSAVPRPGYVGLLGDSYAMGLGDWMQDADPDTNPPFHSAHVLHQLLGRDVLSFARTNDGSMSALVTRPFQTFAYLESTRFALPPPGLFVVYFYEGNDLDNNLRDLEDHLPGHDRERLRDPEYFARFLDLEFREIGRPRRYRPALNDRPIVLRVIRKTLAYALTGWPGSRDPEPIGPGETRAVVGGREVALPEPFQSAGLTLDDAELDTALYAFDQSLRSLRRHWPAVPVLLVFVPAPITTYALSSSHVVVRDEGRDVRVPRDAVATRSDRVCAHLARTAASQGAGFLDVRRELWPVARERFLHGPRDWVHFNRAGYTALAEAIAPAIARDPRAVRACESVAGHFAEADRLAAAARAAGAAGPAAQGAARPGGRSDRATVIVDGQ